ncbi:MAG: hypothetical protein IK990_12855 [Ruminiclostridium sp.]|nr:hypothetical protein [Ruminiclostridium sp.]
MRRNAKDTLYIYAGAAGLVLLFALNVCYVFTALGLLSFGIAALPCVLLGRFGTVAVTSDLAPDALLLISGGILLTGAGACLGIVPVCSSSYGVYRRFARSSALRRERMFNEEDTAS